MINSLIWSIEATFIVSLISVIGIFFLGFKSKTLDKILFLLVAFSAGALMGGAFLHLLPEASEILKNNFLWISTLVGFSLFFLMEKIIKWRHCHHGKCPIHTFTYMNLIGDGVHNFIDGLIIAASFLVNMHFGIVTTIAIIAHEVPQEIGDFGVLVYGGFSKFKALFFNFLTALTAVIGAIVGILLSSSTEGFIPFILPFAAGGFIYIAASDLIPELHKEPEMKKSLLSFVFFLNGIIFMYVTKLIYGG